MASLPSTNENTNDMTLLQHTEGKVLYSNYRPV